LASRANRSRVVEWLTGQWNPSQSRTQTVRNVPDVPPDVPKPRRGLTPSSSASLLDRRSGSRSGGRGSDLSPLKMFHGHPCVGTISPMRIVWAADGGAALCTVGARVPGTDNVAATAPLASAAAAEIR
jgi:hypothetical protein